MLKFYTKILSNNDNNSKNKNSMLRFVILPFLVITSLIVPSYATNINLTASEYHNIIYEESLIDISLFDDNEKRVANELYKRTYSLYPDYFHQQRINEYLNVLENIMSESYLDEQKEVFACTAQLSNIENFKSFLEVLALVYVDNEGYEDTQDTLKMLNYLFVDELAKAKMSGDVNNLDPNFYARLEQQNLKEIFDDFMNDEDVRIFSGLDIDEENPYAITAVLFAVINSDICNDKL